ncbi:MAG: rhodanese-like domain-containing protein [Desulfobacterales bacterium]|nr:rhodanese-like domain-containing protein [Desulfobacterales bacterium]
MYDDAEASVDQMETALNNNGYYIDNVSYLAAHTEVTPQEAKDMIEADGELIIVDVREPDEFCGTGDHIPGAVNYPWNSSVLSQKYSNLSVDSKILVVCGSGKRSHSAAEFLDSNNYTAVYDMTGGMSTWNWETEHCPTECTKPWDADEDKKVSMPDIIFSLQYLSELRESENKPDLQDIIVGLQVLSEIKPCDILISNP